MDARFSPQLRDLGRVPGQLSSSSVKEGDVAPPLFDPLKNSARQASHKETPKARLQALPPPVNYICHYFSSSLLVLLGLQPGCHHLSVTVSRGSSISRLPLDTLNPPLLFFFFNINGASVRSRQCSNQNYLPTLMEETSL